MNTIALKESIKQLRARDPRIAITFNPQQSAITILRGRLANPVNVEALKKSPYQYSRQFIRENRVLLGNIDESTQLDNERATTDRRGMTHVILAQKHGNAKVLGGNLSVHYGADGSLYLLKSNLASAIDIPASPRIESAHATEIAKEHAGAGASLFEGIQPALVVADAKTLHKEQEGKKYYLCWKLVIVSPEKSQDPGWFYLIDAINGTIHLRYPAEQTGSGTGYYSHGSALNSEASGTTYRLRDTVTSSTWATVTKPIIHTYDDHCSTSHTLTNYSEDSDDNWNNGGGDPASRCDDQQEEVDIHRFLSYILDYYYLTHGHNSWDNAGADIKAHAHHDLNWKNASWRPLEQQIYIGDGNGTSFDLMSPLDVLGHEFTHGVNDGFNIIQVYDGETGALNEGIADLFGAFIALNHPIDDSEPWQSAGQCVLPDHRGRNMVDPSRDAAGVVGWDATSNETKYNSALNGYYPDHYSIRYTDALDNNGVHINCPIITHAVYLMINGGTHRLSGVTVTGIGVGPVEQMLYEVISTGLLTNTSDFADFRLAFIEVCQTLYPEELDYLATVKAAFHAVGIGPDLYIRDTLSDQGDEPGSLSCMSPDIIVRQQLANAATLTQIADPTNGSLCQNIELGAGDHYVYFRLFNRGSVAGSGTFRLFISPVSTFPTPATWHEVGHYDFTGISASGGMWVPTAAGECLTLSETLINTLGVGHYCFIGIIESDDDPPPDRTLIDNVSEFHNFISKSNNYAWRNCDVVNLVPDTSGELPTITQTFQINGFGRRYEPRNLELDTRDLPEGTQVTLWLPKTKFYGLKAFEVRVLQAKIGVSKIGGILEELPVEQLRMRPIPLRELVKVTDVGAITPKAMPAEKIPALQALRLSPQKVIRLTGLKLQQEEKINVQFAVKFPRNTGTRSVTLAIRERLNDQVLGQINYIFQIREVPPEAIAKKAFRVFGSVIDAETKQGLGGLRVEAWDKDLICNDLVGTVITDKQGAFQLGFDESYFRELFLDRRPDLFFKVFQDGKMIKSTEDSVIWNVSTGDTQVVIEVARLV
ncbi:M4 family metallopeptidase [Microcystis sp. M061S2]|uniref:M4 family metallopeptidase n=1 Tax=Microcystis sp. M061S2 TaxID=2771171 RepID=UPI002582BB65|nr:M4 family metallopeptidase [Microcystis sp. M061S2]MCA2653478.1 M4 family metallopeptidase [Microcystis sp. M061S2]